MAEINSNLYFRQQAPDVLGSMAQGMRLRDMADTSKMKRAQMEQERIAREQKAKQAQLEKEAYQQGVVQNEDGSNSFDQAKTLSAMRGANPKRAFEMEGQFAKQKADIGKMNIDETLGKLKVGKSILFSVNDESSYQNAKQMGVKNGFPVDDWPPSYDPLFVKTKQNGMLTAEDRFLREKQTQSQSNTDRTFNQNKLNSDRDYLLKKSDSKAKKNKGNSKAASDLRKERSSIPTTKDTQKISAAYNRIQKASVDPSAAGDLALIFNYMKMLDPGSTVREGEFATAQNSGGVNDRVIAKYNNIIRGERLSETQRNDFVGQSRGQYQAQIDLQNNVDASFIALAKKAGIDPKDIIVDFNANKVVDIKNKDLNSASDEEIDKIFKEMGGK